MNNPAINQALFVVEKPNLGLPVEMNLPRDVPVQFGFGIEDISSIRLSNFGQLIIHFVDDSVLVIQNFMALALDDAMAVLDDGTELRFSRFLDDEPYLVTDLREEALTQDLAEDLAGVEPAAGILGTLEIAPDSDLSANDNELDEAELAALALELAAVEPAAGAALTGATGRGGFGFESSVDSSGFDARVQIGPIGETERGFGTPEIPDETFILLGAGAPIALAAVVVPVTNIFEDGNGTPDFSALSPDEADISSVIVVSGIPADWTVVNTNGGVFDPAAGTVTFTIPPGGTITNGPTLAPPANSDEDLDLTVTVTETDNGDGTVTTDTGTITIVVDAVADVPNLATVDSAGNEDTAVPINITATLNDLDGSEVLTAIIVNVPAGFALNSGTAIGGGSFRIDAADIPGLTLTAPANFSGTTNLTIQAVATETNFSGQEPDLTNNVATATDTVNVTFTAVADAPIITVADAVVDEDNSVFVPLQVNLVDADGSENLTVTIGNIPAGVGFVAAGFAATGNPGEFAITLPAGQNLNSGFTITPPANSDVDINGITIAATSTEASNGSTATANDTVNVVVDAVADAPTITANDNAGAQGAAIPVTINAAVTDNDGSETITGFQISGVPAGFTLNGGVDQGGGVFTLSVAEAAALQITPDPAFTGNITLTATAFSSETNTSGVEPDLTDNTASANDTFTLTVNANALPPSINFNNGGAVGGNDANVDEDNSVVVPLAVTLNANGTGNEVLTVTMTGIDPAWGFVFPVGAFNAGTGTWTITLPAGQSLAATNFTFTPPADTDIDLSNLTVTASVFEPSTATTANATDVIDIVVDAVADTPNLTVNAAAGEEGTAIPLTITTSLNDNDGSEVIELIRISNIPAGATLNQGTNLGGGVFTLTEAQLAGLAINVPNGTTGTFNLTVESIAFEQNTNGGEPDLTDNRATAIETLTLTVAVDSVPVIDQPEVVTVAEANLVPTTTVSDQVTASLGNDGPGTFTGTGVFSGGPITSGGDPVVVNFAGDTYTGTAGGQTIFTLVLQNDGNYTFTLNQPLDHPAGNGANNLPLGFGVRVTDSDGDTQDGTITVNVTDDIVDAVDDADTFSTTVGTTSGNVLTNDDLSEDVDNVVSQVTFGLNTVAVPAGGSVNIRGDHGELTIFSTGAYTYVMDAGVVTDEVDTFTYTLTDNDGDTDTANLVVTLDAPDPAVNVIINNGAGNPVVDEDNSVFVPINVTAAGAGIGNGNEVITVTVQGVPATWGFAGGGFVANGNDFVKTFPAGTINIADGFTLTPPANSDEDINGLTVTAVLSDPDQAGDLTTTNTVDVITDAVADAPNLFVPGVFSTVQFTNPSTVPFVVTSSLNDTDGSEVLTIQVQLTNAMANAGVTLSAGTNLGGGLFELTPGQLAGLTLNLPGGSAGNNLAGVHNIVVTAIATETNFTGVEPDLTDNVATTVGTMALTILFTPLVLDLDGDGVELVNIDDGIMFDMTQDGVVDRTGWVAADDGFLTLDLNGDGIINDSSEMFGGAVTDGFSVLSDFDSNGDNQISSADDVWLDLTVWQDINQDGISQADEIVTLDALGIASINLDAQDADIEQNGNFIKLVSDFTYNNGDSGEIVDAYFPIEDGTRIGEGVTINGTSGDDVISGTQGNDSITGGAGADTFVFAANDNGVDTIFDFSAEDGDRLDLSALLENYDDVQDSINDFVFATDQGDDLVVSVNKNGTGTEGAENIAVLKNTSTLDIDSIVTSVEDKVA